MMILTDKTNTKVKEEVAWYNAEEVIAKLQNKKIKKLSSLKEDREKAKAKKK